MKKYILAGITMVALLLSVSVYASHVESAVNSEQEVSVSVPDTSLEVSGTATASGFVTIQLDGSTVGTTVAGSNGNFSKTLRFLESGLHTVSIFFTDDDGQISDSVSQNVNLLSQQKNSVNVVLPPTLTLSPNSIVAGQPFTVAGYTYPGSEVTITLDNNTTYAVNSDAAGYYQELIGTGGLVGGQHSLRALVTLPDNSQSQLTQPRLLQLNFGDDTNNDALPGVVEDPSLLPAPTILSPANNTTLFSNGTTVSGTGLAQRQLELYDGEQLLGSLFINANGRWELPVVLANETYSLRARVCSDDTCGSFSPTVTVNRGLEADYNPFVFELDSYRLYNVDVGESVVQDIRFISGRAPFTVLVDWGDGDVERLQANTDRLFRLEHEYEQSGNYSATISVSERGGAFSTQYFSIEVRLQPSSPILPLAVSLPAIFFSGYALHRINNRFTSSAVPRR